MLAAPPDGSGVPGIIEDALPHIMCDMCPTLGIAWSMTKIRELEAMSRHEAYKTLMIDQYFLFLKQYGITPELLKKGKSALMFDSLANRRVR